jgi:hypothetical protein
MAKCGPNKKGMILLLNLVATFDVKPCTLNKVYDQFG